MMSRLSGKQHFGGADQYHGFQEQLARDLHAERYHAIHAWDDGIAPASSPGTRSMKRDRAGPRNWKSMTWSRAGAGILARSRPPKTRPWALNVSFIAPHFPYIVPQRFWDMYPPDEMDLPIIPDGTPGESAPDGAANPHDVRLSAIPDDVVRRARAGYYALITYLDEKIGELLDTAGSDRSAREYRHHSPQRSWRYERRARHVAQVELLRGVSARAAASRLARADGWRADG